jgi:hypothetical protein
VGGLVRRKVNTRNGFALWTLFVAGAAGGIWGFFNLVVLGAKTPSSFFNAALGLAVSLVTWFFAAPEVIPAMMGRVARLSSFDQWANRPGRRSAGLSDLALPLLPTHLARSTSGEVDTSPMLAGALDVDGEVDKVAPRHESRRPLEGRTPPNPDEPAADVLRELDAIYGELLPREETNPKGTARRHLSRAA